jgi:hypothetical protein
MPAEMPPTRPTRRLLPLAVADAVAVAVAGQVWARAWGFGAARRVALTTFRSSSS